MNRVEQLFSFHHHPFIRYRLPKLSAFPPDHHRASRFSPTVTSRRRYPECSSAGACRAPPARTPLRVAQELQVGARQGAICQRQRQPLQAESDTRYSHSPHEQRNFDNTKASSHMAAGQTRTRVPESRVPALCPCGPQTGTILLGRPLGARRVSQGTAASKGKVSAHM